VTIGEKLRRQSMVHQSLRMLVVLFISFWYRYPTST